MAELLPNLHIFPSLRFCIVVERAPSHFARKWPSISLHERYFLHASSWVVPMQFALYKSQQLKIYS